MPYIKILNVLADPTRRTIYERLRQAPSHANELVAHLSMSQPAISQHLKVLRDAGLITEARDGPRRVYSIVTGALDDLQDYLRQLSLPSAASAAAGQDDQLLPDAIATAAQLWEKEWPGQSAHVYSITMRLLQLGRHVERSLKETAERHALQGSELLLLDALTLTPGHTLTPSQLQQRLGITKGAITKLLDRLESLDLIKRLPLATDRRVSLVSLTQKAHETLEEILNHHEYGVDHAAAKRLSAEDLTRLATLLQRFHGLLDDEIKQRAEK